MKVCSKILDDGATLVLDSYPRYRETGRFLDRLFQRKVYSLGLERMAGAVRISISDASTRLVMRGIYLSRAFYLKAYNRIKNEKDFHNAETEMRNIEKRKK